MNSILILNPTPFGGQMLPILLGIYLRGTGAFGDKIRLTTFLTTFLKGRKESWGKPPLEMVKKESKFNGTNPF